jgi:hypothetical protein
MAARWLPAVMAVVLAATLAAGVATAAARGSGGGVRACVNSEGDLRLLNGAVCPKGDKLTTLGQRGAKGAPGRAAKREHDDVGQTSQQTHLAVTKNTVTKIVTLRSLPAGSWVFSSDVTVVNFGRADYFRCKIVAGANQVASGASTVGTPRASGSVAGVPPGAATVAGISLIGSETSTKKFTASLDCWHDLKVKLTRGAGPPYLDPGAVLLARPVGSITQTNQ